MSGMSVVLRLLSNSTTMLALLVGSCAAMAEADQPRRFEVHDSVEMAHFGTLASSAPDDLDDDGIVSPDGRYFIKVTHRGVLPQGVTEGTIWLFDTATIEKSLRDAKLGGPEPLPLARMSASVNGGLGIAVLDAGNTVSAPQWSEDSRSLTFLGRNGRVNRQLFRVDLESHQVQALTPSTQDVLDYARSGTEFVYLAGPDADLQADEAWVSAGPGIPDITVGTRTPLMPLLYPHFRGNAYGEALQVELWRIHEGHPVPVIDTLTDAPVKVTTGYASLLVSLSPDATHAVTIGADLGRDESAKKSNGSPAAPVRALHYRTIDLRSGQAESLQGVSIAADIPGRYRAVWARDGLQIALTKVRLAAPVGESNRPCEIAVLRIKTNEVECVASPDQKGPKIFALDWVNQDQILARYKMQSTYSYRLLHRRGTTWAAEARLPPNGPWTIELSVHEDLNEPPVLVATDIRSGKSRAIFDPNPQLANIALGTVSIFRWKDPHGREAMGGLVLPPDFTRGKRYGLVIQTHGFDPTQFFRVGYSDTSNAGRALAGRDLIVLQVREPKSDSPSWRDGVELGLDVYLAAIDKLAADGLVDPSKVGISGFSYAGWLVANAITRAPERFAAAELANSDPVTLTGYYEYVGTPAAAEVAKYYVGARPYGEGLKEWIERVPSLSTDKITAPVLFQPADPWHLLGMYDMYAAMLDQGKPVELQYIRSGEHVIRKPLQVLWHQEMLVDWFDFWLNGHEVPSADKTEQYARWREMRKALRTGDTQSSAFPAPSPR
jgi:dipeptidyl aminopeptidase/acylaminoacyl peptidase